ncbi:MAG: LysR substrate-binding domain-containing protein, partial [Myxococcota bacterium]
AASLRRLRVCRSARSTASLPKGTVAVTEEPADLTLGVAAPSTGFDSHKLFNDPWVCLVRDGHPGVKKKKGLNLERFLNYAHVTLGRDAVDRALRQTRNRRREAARVRDPWQLASIIQHTDHLSVLPKSVAGVLAAGLPVRWVALPLVVPPQTVSLSWPTQRTTDPAHQWLRREVTAALEKIGANS